jgi:hypothetical protein
VCLRRAGAPVSTKVLHWPGQENNLCHLHSLNTAMKTLKSFGCSFIYGSDLLDCTDFNHSQLTWPALIASELNFKYQCLARPGQGNFKIYADILANSDPDEDSIFLINWTWIDRYDYIDHQETWQTLRPANENQLQKFYYQNLHSQMHDMIRDATFILSAARHLQQLKIPYVMTYMDDLLFESVDLSWHNPKYVESLQVNLTTVLESFDGVNFLTWAKNNNFEISQHWHPLEAAHSAAAKFWGATVKTLCA